MKREDCIIGAGGHSRSLINLMELNKFTITGIYDDSFDNAKKELISGYKLKGLIKDVPLPASIVLAIGDNNRREELFNKFNAYVLRKNVIHPTAILEKNVEAGASNFIFSGAYLNSQVKIGNNNIINTHAVLEHESKVGSNNHISIGSLICGRVRIGDNCFIGAGATLIDKITITDNVIIGANSAVVKDITAPGVYVGNPARKIK